MNHYTVCTPPLFHDYGYDEPPETFAECVTVIAANKRQAKVEAVRKFREEGNDYVNDLGSPFTGLKVWDSKCEHGNCWCDLSSCLDTRGYDICPECEEKDKNECEHEMFTGLIQQADWSEARNVEHCFQCGQTREQIDARTNQKFKVLA